LTPNHRLWPLYGHELSTVQPEQLLLLGLFHVKKANVSEEVKLSNIPQEKYVSFSVYIWVMSPGYSLYLCVFETEADVEQCLEFLWLRLKRFDVF